MTVRRGRGHPTLLTPEVKQRFIDAIRAGSYYDVACAYAGISYTTFRDWMQRGQGTHKTRKADRLYVDFAEEVLAAEAQGELSAIAAIKGASKEDWRAAAWMLERRHKTRWSNSHKVEIEVQERAAQEINVIFEAIANAKIPDEYKRELMRDLTGAVDRMTVGATDAN